MTDRRPTPDFAFRYKGKDLYVYQDLSNKPPYRKQYRVTWPPVGEVTPGCTIGEEQLDRLRAEGEIIETRRAAA